MQRLQIMCGSLPKGLTYKAFELAEKYRNVVIILSDGAISQMIEKCQLPEPYEHDIDQFDWTLSGKPLGEKKNKVTNLDRTIGVDAYETIMKNKFQTMFQDEQRWEELMTDDVLLACKHRRPVYGHLTAVRVPTAEGIVSYCEEILAGKAEPMEVL